MRYTLIIIGLIVLASCKRAPLAGYKKINDSFGYKIVTDIDTGTLQGNGKYVVSFANVRNDKDSLVLDPIFGDSTGFSFQVILQPPKHANDLMHVFNQLSDGDSVIIKMKADTFFSRQNFNHPLPANVKPGSFITFHVKVIRLLDADEYIEWQEEETIQMKAAAYAGFQQYLKTVNVEQEPIGSGIVMVNEREGSGKNPKFGDQVRIHYMMVTFSGTELANTYKTMQPYDFMLGSNEVVYGLNEALLQMKKGGKSRIYIPYYLAYGAEGVEGMVAPYTHLVMDVELLEIQ